MSKAGKRIELPKDRAKPKGDKPIIVLGWYVRDVIRFAGMLGSNMTEKDAEAFLMLHETELRQTSIEAGHTWMLGKLREWCSEHK